jgi:hypothetical protein
MPALQWQRMGEPFGTSFSRAASRVWAMLVAPSMWASANSVARRTSEAWALAAVIEARRLVER